jgi:hypothetical protein
VEKVTSIHDESVLSRIVVKLNGKAEVEIMRGQSSKITQIRASLVMKYLEQARARRKANEKSKEGR